MTIKRRFFRLFVLSAIVVTASIGFSLYESGGRQKPATTSEHTGAAVIESKEPSGRALKVAASFYVALDDEKRKSIEEEYSTNKPAEAIRHIAIRLEKNPEMLAYFEASLAQPAQKAPTVVNNYEYAQEQPTTLKPLFQPSIEEQIEEQQKEIEDIKSDLQWDCIRNGGAPMGNSCF